MEAIALELARVRRENDSLGMPVVIVLFRSSAPVAGTSYKSTSRIV
jgi:hypothetical protein